MLPADETVCLSHRPSLCPCPAPPSPAGTQVGRQDVPRNVSVQEVWSDVNSMFRCYGVGLEHHPLLELVHPILSVL